MRRKTIEEKLPPLGVCPYCGSKKYVDLNSISERDYDISELNFECERCQKDWVSYVKHEALDTFGDEFDY